MMKKASHWRFGLGLLVASAIVVGSIWSVAMQSAVVGADVTTAPSCVPTSPWIAPGPVLEAPQCSRHGDGAEAGGIPSFRFVLLCEAVSFPA